jgi:hypothetical protein
MKLPFSQLLLTAAGLAHAASLPSTGPHKVDYSGPRAFKSRSGRIVRFAVWQPGDRTEGPFPLVLFSPGFGNTPSQYLSQLEDLASHG